MTASLSTFVLDRLAEDEARAKYAQTRDEVDDRSPGGWGGWWLGHYQHYHRHDPARVLADVAAKRAIVAKAERAEAAFQQMVNPASSAASFALIEVLQMLANTYADHPEFDPAWKVEP